MKKYEIAVLEGDGIGPEVMTEALKVLKVIEKKYDREIGVTKGWIGGAAIDRFETPLPQETVDLCKKSGAVLLGSVGGPKWDHLPPEQKPELGGLLAIRKQLSLYANLRPVKLYPELKKFCPLAADRIEGGVDILTFRELSGGIYFGEPKTLSDSEGIDTMVYNKETVLAIAEAAFKAARNRSKKVMSVDKANVLHSSILWRKTVEEVASRYPDVELQHMYVDNAAMQLILNPGQFDILLTTNLFGDILSDESAALAGSLGMLPSASLGKSVHLYEPSGGSAPDIAGKGIANPIAQILSAAMMLDYSFGEVDASQAIFKGVETVLADGLRTGDIAASGEKTVSTVEIGDAICDAISKI